MDKSSYSPYKKNLIPSLPADELSKMKNKYETIQADSILEEILTKAEKDIQLKKTILVPKRERQDEFLEELKNRAAMEFSINMIKLDRKEILEDFEKRLTKYNLDAKVFLDKKAKENLEYLNQVKIMNNKIDVKDIEVHEIKEEVKKLRDELYKSESKINSYDKKLELYAELKPIFVEFYKEYPDDDPAEILSDLKRLFSNREKVQKEMSDLYETIESLLKEKNEAAEANRRFVDELINKLNDTDREKKSLDEKYINEIKQYKSEIERLTKYKDENIHMNNMLFGLYNQLVERFAIDKGLGVNKDLSVKEEDFRPNLLDNNEIRSIISNMLVLSSENSSAQLVREIVAYTNMLLRLFGKNEVSKRYKPSIVFKELQMAIENDQTEKNRYKQENIIAIKKIKDLETEIHKKDNLMKHMQKIVEYSKKKYVDVAELKLKKSQTYRESQKSEKWFSKKTSPIQTERSTAEIMKPKTSDEELLMNKKYEKYINFNLLKENICPYCQNYLRLDTERSMQIKVKDEDKVFLTENKTTTFSRKSTGFPKPVTEARPATSTGKSATTPYSTSTLKPRPFTGKTQTLTVADSFSKHYKTETDDTSKQDDFFKAKNFKTRFEEKESEVQYKSQMHKAKTTYSYNNLIIGKNRDKLILKSSKKPSTEETQIFHNMLTRTNNLMVYRSRLNVDRHNVSQNVFKVKDRALNGSLSRLKKVKQDELLLSGDFSYQHDKISNDIDSLIRSIEKQKLD